MDYGAEERKNAQQAEETKPEGSKAELSTDGKKSKKEYQSYNPFKTMICKVLKYNEKSRVLDISFKGYGLRFYNAEKGNGDTVKVRYKGTIGKSDFVCELNEFV